MSEKRFKSTIDEETMSIMPFLVSDNEEEAFYNLQGCVDLLNEQQATISDLKEENEQLKEYCIVLKNQIKRMGELGGFNKHMIKTILESNYDE